MQVVSNAMEEDSTLLLDSDVQLDEQMQAEKFRSYNSDWHLHLLYTGLGLGVALLAFVGGLRCSGGELSHCSLGICPTFLIETSLHNSDTNRDIASPTASDDTSSMTPSIPQANTGSLAAIHGFDASMRSLSPLRLSVVFNAFINPQRDWRQLIHLQLLDIIDTGLTASATVHVCLSIPALNYSDASAEELGNEGEDFIRAVLPSALIHRSMGNRFEYPGIRMVWDLAQMWLNSLEPGTQGEQEYDPTRHLILYFHTKGMVNAETGVVRSDLNDILTTSHSTSITTRS
jgi:hypothetical protein